MTSKENETKTRTVGFMGGKYLPLHQGHIYAILDASNQVDTLYVVLSSSKNRDRELCERDGIKYTPSNLRLSWLGKALNNIDNIEIIHVEDDQWDNNYDWEDGARMIKEAIGRPIDFVFSSEPSYGVHFEKYYPNTKHVIVDDKRKTVTVSATEIRRNLYQYWDKLPASVRSHFTKKVAIVGTESCGKSTLVKKLAKFYNTTYVHEVGRDFCEEYSNRLTPEMFNQIAMEHFLLQKTKSEESNKVLFVDSEAVITQFYFDMYFPGSKSSLIEEIVKLQNYDLVLYLEPDVKWVDDGSRFGGETEVRQRNNETLKRMYAERGINFVSISGDYKQRFDTAKSLVDKLFIGEK